MLNYGVVTICLNSERTIARTIQSVLDQDVLPEKYVFVDGGSVDRTVRIIDEFGYARVERPEFEILRQPAGGGIPAAWNMGIARLATDIVFLLNSDDSYEPGTARTVLEKFEACPDAAIVAGNTNLTAEGSHRSMAVLKPLPGWMFPFTNPIPHPSCFVRRGAYDRVGPFDERYKVSADYDFMYRCYRAGLRRTGIRRTLTNMQWGGTTAKNRRIAVSESLDIAQRHCPFRILPRIGHVVRRCREMITGGATSVRDIHDR